MKNLKNNKGFSLVELIIVIAIMAVLIGILAPQYLRYVEKSRLSADNDYIDSVRKACEAIASDPSVNLQATTYTITIKHDNSVDVAVNVNGGTDTPATLFVDELAKIVETKATKTPLLKSKTYTTGNVDPTILVNFAGGNATVTVGGNYTAPGTTPTPVPSSGSGSGSGTP